MTAEHFQTIVIGAGSGGMTVAIGLAGLGRRVALIEGNHVGGDCTNVGCVPSKTLIYLAKNFNTSTDPDQVLQEVICKRDALRDKETEEVKHIENLTFIRGMARLTGPKALVVTNNGATRELTADNTVIATGASAGYPSEAAPARRAAQQPGYRSAPELAGSHPGYSA